MRVEPLSDSNVRAWGELFARASTPCFCRWWHFEGVKNDWLARCAVEPETNRAEAESRVHAGGEEVLGLVAFEGEDAVGWMKLTPRAQVPKLRGLPIYRALDLGADASVWSVGCFLVDPGHRRRGVAEALLDAAPAFVRDHGGALIEAYPRHVHETEHARLHDEEAWMGPEALFLSRGFTRAEGLGETKMYPVYRLAVAIGAG